MIQTTSKIYFTDARRLTPLQDQSVDLVVTSPPYPMIQMWDQAFCQMNPEVQLLLESEEGNIAFELMHQELDKVWREILRVLKPGGIVCLNIGDATRTLKKNFQLFSNHSRILNACINMGFSCLPAILWRKQTNAPNKFMGSGTLPVGAYVTLEHEYILILRKGRKREFQAPDQKHKRKESAFFWEERNNWFSDIWDFKGRRQALSSNKLRKRSAAFPYELAYRLVNMYSVKGDLVIDPFLGTGTSMLASITSCRNFIGFEIDENFSAVIRSEIGDLKKTSNNTIRKRLENHRAFAEDYEKNKKPMKYVNSNYNFPVMTKPETEILLNPIKKITFVNNTYITDYSSSPLIRDEFLFAQAELALH